MTTIALSEARTRLAVAEADAARALAEVAQLGRLLINDELQGPFTLASLAAMKERLQVLRHAVGDLEHVHADLRRRAVSIGDPDRARSESADAGEIEARHRADRGAYCRRCLRADAISPVTICVRCSRPPPDQPDRWITGTEAGPQSPPPQIAFAAR